MATPVGDSNTTASGGAIAAGRHRFPSWRTGQAVGEWRELSGSAMSNTPPTVNPGRASGSVSAKMDAWCGLAIDTRSNVVWSLANGGHDDYHGNEVMKINLGANSPAWVEMLPSNTAAEFTIPNNAGYYSSGRPASAHTYYSQHFIEARNRAVRFGTRATSSSGNMFPNVDGYDCSASPGANGWDSAGAYPDAPSSGAANSQAFCKNPVTEDVYSFNTNNAVFKWTQETNTWAQVNSGYPPIDPSESASAYDTTRNRILIFKGSTNHHTFDPATGIFTDRTFTGSAASTLQASSPSPGMIYEPALDAYLVRLGRAAGGAVYRIDPATFEVTPLTTTGGASIPTTANISGSPENVYGRWLYAPKLGGAFFFPQYAANAWFLRTH